MTSTPEYGVWSGMIQRCTNPNASHYERYGGRGIGVCERWRDSFESFYGDMGPRPGSCYELDRINNDGDYEPGNCRWIQKKENANNRSTTRKIRFRGKCLSLAEWSEQTGLSAKLISYRLVNGWSIEDALTQPSADSGKRARIKARPRVLTALSETPRSIRELCELSGLDKQRVNNVLFSLAKCGKAERSGRGLWRLST